MSGAVSALSGILGSADIGDIRHVDAATRSYYCETISKGKVANRSSTSVIETLYQIEKRERKNGIIQPYAHLGGKRLSQSFYLSKEDADSINGHKTRAGLMQAFTSTSTRCDLSMIVYVCMACVIKYFEEGDLGWADLTGGRPVEVTAVDTGKNDTVYGDKDLFIPDIPGENTGMTHSWVAAVGVACGCGASVYTNRVARDPDGYIAIPELTGLVAARACLEVVLRIGGQMSRAQAACIWANAVTFSVHNCQTVVSHTDEGGSMRRVWRHNGFIVPYGSVTIGKAKISGVGEPAYVDASSLMKFVDTISLVTAAGTAMLDPGEEIDNRRFPTGYTNGMVGRDEFEGLTPQQRLVRKRQLARQIRGQMQAGSNRFCAKQAEFFDLMLGQTSSKKSRKTVHAFRGSQFAGYYDTADKHVEASAVSPYFWIESVGLISDWADGLVEVEHYKPYALVDKPKKVPAFPNMERIGAGGSMSSDIKFDMLGARLVPAVAHLENRVGDGQGLIVIKQLHAEHVMYQGGNEAAATMVERGAHLGEYMWHKATNMLPSPHEMQVRTGSVFATVHHGHVSGGSVHAYDGLTAAEVGQEFEVHATQPAFVGFTKRRGEFRRIVNRRATLSGYAAEFYRNARVAVTGHTPPSISGDMAKIRDPKEREAVRLRIGKTARFRAGAAKAQKDWKEYVKIFESADECNADSEEIGKYVDMFGDECACFNDDAEMEPSPAGFDIYGQPEDEEDSDDEGDYEEISDAAPEPEEVASAPPEETEEPDEKTQDPEEFMSADELRLSDGHAVGDNGDMDMVRRVKRLVGPERGHSLEEEGVAGRKWRSKAVAALSLLVLHKSLKLDFYAEMAGGDDAAREACFQERVLKAEAEKSRPDSVKELEAQMLVVQYSAQLLDPGDSPCYAIATLAAATPRELEWFGAAADALHDRGRASTGMREYCQRLTRYKLML